MVRAAVAVINIVGVLPDVEGQEGLEALAHRVAGIRLLGDHQFAFRVGGEPHPAAAEEACALRHEFLLEGVEPAEIAVDRRGEFAGGGVVRARRAELREIEVVVQGLAGVVQDAAFGSLDDLLEAFAFPGAAGQGRIQVVDVGQEVLSVVEGKGLGADGGRECVRRIGEFYQCKHGFMRFNGLGE